MFEDFKDILSKTSSKSDVAVVLIAGTTGFLIDAGLNFIGFLQPGAVGVTFASGALGIKKGIEAFTEKKKIKKLEAKKLEEEKNELQTRIRQLLQLLKDETSIEILEEDYKLYNLGLLSKEDLEVSVAKIIQTIRDRDRSHPITMEG